MSDLNHPVSRSIHAPLYPGHLSVTPSSPNPPPSQAAGRGAPDREDAAPSPAVHALVTAHEEAAGAALRSRGASTPSQTQASAGRTQLAALQADHTLRLGAMQQQLAELEKQIASAEAEERKLPGTASRACPLGSGCHSVDLFAQAQALRRDIHVVSRQWEEASQALQARIETIELLSLPQLLPGSAAMISREAQRRSQLERLSQEIEQVKQSGALAVVVAGVALAHEAAGNPLSRQQLTRAFELSAGVNQLLESFPVENRIRRNLAPFEPGVGEEPNRGVEQVAGPRTDAREIPLPRKAEAASGPSEGDSR